MEKEIEKTLKDVEKQIISIFSALQNDGFINEAPLLEIPVGQGQKMDDTLMEVDMDVDEDVVVNTRNSRSNSKAVNVKSKKTHTVTASQLKSKKMEMDSAPMDMEQSMEKYVLIQSSVFCIPVMDTWVFGITVVNSSDKAQNVPELILNMIPKEIGVVDKPCRVFTYSSQVTPLDVKQLVLNIKPCSKQDSTESRKVHQGIPFAFVDTFIPPSSNQRASSDIKINPGCQVLLTATFTHPQIFCNKKNDFSLIVSVLLDDIQLWSRTIPVSMHSFIYGNYIESTMKTHQVSILSAFGDRKEYFKMKRLITQGDKSPHKAVEKFLGPLGLQKIFNESTGIDTIVEIYSSTNLLSPLWGLFFKLEKCVRNVNMIRCLLSARSQMQMEIFLNMFESWLKKETLEERKKGLTGLSVSPTRSTTEDKNMLKTLSTEIKVIINLIDLNSKWQLTNSANSQLDRQWILKFMNALSATDSLFMNDIFEL